MTLGKKLVTKPEDITVKDLPAVSKFVFKEAPDLAVRNVYDALNEMYITKAQLTEIVKKEGKAEARKFARDNKGDLAWVAAWEPITKLARSTGNSVEEGNFQWKPGMDEKLEKANVKLLAMKKNLSEIYPQWVKLDEKRKNALSIEEQDSIFTSMKDLLRSSLKK